MVLAVIMIAVITILMPGQGNVAVRIEYIGNVIIKLSDYYQMVKAVKTSKTDGVEQTNMSRAQRMAVAQHEETLYGLMGVTVTQYNLMAAVECVQKQMQELPTYHCAGAEHKRQVSAIGAMMT